MKRVQTYVDKAAATVAVRAINQHYLAQPRTVVRGERAPADSTERYLLLEQYADGAWGHVVDGYVRELAAAQVISLPSERDMPKRTVSALGMTIETYAAAATDRAASDRPLLEADVRGGGR